MKPKRIILTSLNYKQRRTKKRKRTKRLKPIKTHTKINKKNGLRV